MKRADQAVPLCWAPDGVLVAASDGVNGNWSYSYDALNRLLTATCTAGTVSCPGQAAGVKLGLGWSYDRRGNRWTQTETAGTGLTTAYSFTNGHNRLDGALYDAAGDLENDGANTYCYDGEGRVVKVFSGNQPCSAPSPLARYVYDGEGRRVERVTAQGTWDAVYDLAGRVMSEYDAADTWSRGEVWAGGRHLATYHDYNWPDAALYFSSPDGLGSERLRTRTGGSLAETCTSLPFGDGQACSGSDPSPLHFTGQPRDAETGLDDFGARLYSSSLGRWMTPDPLGGQLEDPQSLNRYVYARDNPVTLTDSTGLSFALDCAQDNGTTCQGGHVYYQDENGKYRETMINSGKNDVLTDQQGNRYNGTFDGKQVTFTAADGSKSTGAWIQGSQETKGITGTGSLNGFKFTFENHGSGQTLNAIWKFNGTTAQAETALTKAGYANSFWDTFDPDHKATLGVMPFSMRSPGDPYTGANSGHFLVNEPYIFGPYGRIPLLDTVPATGESHFGEHNPFASAAAFLAHMEETH